MADDRRLQALQGLDFTRDLELYQQEKLAGMAREVSFAAGDLIFRLEEPCQT